PPVGAGEISPLALKRATQRTALAMLTPKRLAAALRDMPPSTTAPTTRSRRSSESAIPAASFPRRLSSSRSKPIRESLPRFNSLGDRSNDIFLGVVKLVFSRAFPPVAVLLVNTALALQPRAV